MPTRVKGVFSTLKHGGYSAKTILPGESLAKFKRLERDVIDDLRPDGAFEQDTVMRIVQLLWRRQNRNRPLAAALCAGE